MQNILFHYVQALSEVLLHEISPMEKIVLLLVYDTSTYSILDYYKILSLHS